MPTLGSRSLARSRFPCLATARIKTGAQNACKSLLTCDVSRTLLKPKHECKILLFVCCIPSSQFVVEPGPMVHDQVLLFNAVIQSSFSFIGLCRTDAKLPQTCLCCRRLLVGSGVNCIAIRIVTLTLVFFSLESLLQF